MQLKTFNQESRCMPNLTATRFNYTASKFAMVAKHVLIKSFAFYILQLYMNWYCDTKLH